MGAQVQHTTNGTPLPKDFVVTQGLLRGEGGHWLKHIADHPVVWVEATTSQKLEDMPTHSRTVSTTHWKPVNIQMLADVMKAITTYGTTTGECLQQYRDCLVAVNNTVRARRDRVEQVQHTLQEAQTIFKGQGHRVRPD